MIYRTSQRGTYRNITSNLDLLSWRIAQLSNKMASEKNVNKPSDDPSGAAAILRTRTTLSETAQHKANVDYANTWLTNSGNVMDSVKGALDEIYAKAEQGATDTYTADQRRIIATEIDALFQSIIQFSDSKFGDNYLLGGSKVDSPPFSQLLRAQDVVAACENSTLWTGAVQNWGGREFEPRPDLPTQSQKFLVEVVQAGGVDSRFYATQSSLSTARIDGGDYVLKIDAKDQSFNQTKIRLATGPENVDRTGAANSEVVYSFNPASADPLTVIYVHGPTTMSSAVAAEYSAAAHTVTVRLKTVGFDPPSASAQTSSEVTAWAIASAVNALGVVSAAASLGGAGQVDLAPGPGGQPLNTVISFNHKTSVEVDGDEVTIYLERATNYLGGAVTATAQEAADALSADPIAGARLTASILGDPTAVAQATTAFRPLLPTDPYTLAQVVAEIPGTHNDVAFFVQNVSGAPVGEAGNGWSVRYVFAEPPQDTAATTAALSGQTIVVTLGSSGSVFLEQYGRLYSNPDSPAFQNAAEAQRLARLAAVTADGQAVISAVSALSDSQGLFIGAKMAEGESGLGRMVPGGPFQLAEGYDQPALFRVSQDGGLTWGPPQAFSPSEFQTGGLFYNSQLGHASLTTSLPGQANDLVFTANYLGTWGDDVRIEYRAPQPGATNQPLSVEVSSQWNICVNLATDSAGQLTATAQDVMEAINAHPQAGQLVTVG
ncbi:MAG: hypothetical protein LBU12_09130, partial [Deltaproteobacteria bacterium]|nr:hypothetical protein [Deltaproteobacteria bacterium]